LWIDRRRRRLNAGGVEEELGVMGWCWYWWRGRYGGER